MRPLLCAAALLLPGLASAARFTPAAPMRVCVYHDAGKGDGQLHGIMLKNLLGHFQEVRAELRPVQSYRSGELKGCERAAYLGTLWGSELPAPFIKEAAAYSKPFLWVNYGIWALQHELGPGRFSAKTGFLFRKIRGWDRGGPEDGVPGFFRDFHYKGVVLPKKARREKSGRLIGSPELAVVDALDARVLAFARHSNGRESAPYVLEKGGFFYVADNPFFFLHEQDRYLIFADILFDFLKLPPRERRRHALVRLEDVHPDYDLRLLYRTVRLLKNKDVPFAVSVIPKYVKKGAPEHEGKELLKRRAFLRALRYVEHAGGTLLLHGYTHHVPDIEGCPSLGSGADYEFWDRCKNAPLPWDSTRFLHQRVAAAKALFAQAGLEAAAWVTPHYAASPSNFKLFGRLFERTVQRVCYFPDGAEGPPHPYMSQFFPYTIYRDHYGQYIWPENLGFVPMPGSDWGYDTPPDISETVRKARVVRDGWASFFWHPHLAATEGGLRKLEELLDEIRTQGFTFVSLKELKASGG